VRGGDRRLVQAVVPWLHLGRLLLLLAEAPAPSSFPLSFSS
jgi:hypothetical protein